jgi:NADH-quinone oxidoreductase subunit N
MTALGFMTVADVWNSMGPEIVLTGAGFIIMILEFLVHGRAKAITPWLAVIACLGGIFVAALRLAYPVTNLGTTVVRTDGFAEIFAIVILLATALILLLAIGSERELKLPYEYSYLVLFATVGAIVIASANDLIMLYVGLELLSVASYVLVAIHRKSTRSTEGGMKYLIVGSIGSASILYGLSFLYGIAGTTSFNSIPTALQNAWTADAGILLVSIALVLAGVAVKISAVPFHLWTADVYEGAPTPVTSYLAVVSKAAVIALIFRLFLVNYGQKLGEWDVIVAWIGVITMIVGNFGALAQQNVKRLLAYSSIAQIGYLLVPFAILGASPLVSNLYQALTSVLYYLFAYAFMTIGAFAVFHVVASARNSEQMDAFHGLYRRSPWLAGAMTVFLLSLAGLPLTAGFIGKFYIFLDAFNAGQYWLGVILFATSAIAFYYYFGIIRAMFARQPQGDHTKIKSSGVLHAVFAVCVIGTLFLGIIPTPLLSLLQGLHWFG